ncbi:class I lanthipeptide [Rhodanobacter sp. A1T4]|uniref:class I lanthipeptide n=1 Tax=Rhodanobacter sp. A1T4 TaxID=2723087 RepID=UPI001611EA6D|nr:class I lanthipeptide [Rhodanobacter sp. A1T4]MBB6249445.1 hypothetical protein [Rhodanobacter sp. A1T4]
MKPIKKLTLSKETLAILTDEETKMVGGAVATTPNTNGNNCSIPCGTDDCGHQATALGCGGAATGLCGVSVGQNCASNAQACAGSITVCTA